MPTALSSALSSSVTRGRQPPQPVPALVQVFTCGDCRQLLVPDRRADLALADVVARANLGIELAADGRAEPADSRRSPGGIVSGLPLLNRPSNMPKSDASPTRTPPEQAGAFAIEDELLVDAAERVFIRQAPCAPAPRRRDRRSWRRRRPSASAWSTCRSRKTSASTPSRFAAATSAISYPGATRP